MRAPHLLRGSGARRRPLIRGRCLDARKGLAERLAAAVAGRAVQLLAAWPVGCRCCIQRLELRAVERAQRLVAARVDAPLA
jgi:hypothetical protein